MTDKERSQALAAAIKAARSKPVRMSRKELAKRAGLNESTIQKIEDGRSSNPGIFTVAAIAVALDLDVTDLLRSRTGPLTVRRLSTPVAGSRSDKS